MKYRHFWHGNQGYPFYHCYVFEARMARSRGSCTGAAEADKKGLRNPAPEAFQSMSARASHLIDYLNLYAAPTKKKRPMAPS